MNLSYGTKTPFGVFFIIEFYYCESYKSIRSIEIGIVFRKIISDKGIFNSNFHERVMRKVVVDGDKHFPT